MILLKNEVKDIFTKYGLDNFTVGRNSNGYLDLVGDCGKPLVQITNFAIGSKLTKKEREICIDDYIIPTLSKHAASVKKLIDAKKDEFDKQEILNLEIKKQEKKYKVNFDIADNVYYRSNKILYYSDKKENIENISMNKHIDEKLKVSIDIVEKTNFKIVEKIINQMYIDYETLELKLDTLKKAIELSNKTQKDLTEECKI